MGISPWDCDGHSTPLPWFRRLCTRCPAFGAALLLACHDCLPGGQTPPWQSHPLRAVNTIEAKDIAPQSGPWAYHPGTVITTLPHLTGQVTPADKVVQLVAGGRCGYTHLSKCAHRYTEVTLPQLGAFCLGALMAVCFVKYSTVVRSVCSKSITSR